MPSHTIARATQSALPPTGNRFLNQLPEKARERLYPHLRPIDLPLGKVLHEAGDVLEYVYFPTGSIIALLSVMESGASTEIAVVAFEGLVGVDLFMGRDSMPSRAIVQSAGQCYTLPARLLKSEFYHHHEMRMLILRHA